MKEYAAVNIMQGLLAGGDTLPEETPELAVELADDLISRLIAPEILVVDPVAAMEAPGDLPLSITAG